MTRQCRCTSPQTPLLCFTSFVIGMALVLAATGVWKPRLSWGVEVGALLAATVLVVLLVGGVAYLSRG